MKDYELKISQFIDNELSVDEQQELFRFLAENQEARETLADYMEMKNESKAFYTEMDIESDGSNIIGAVLEKGSDKGKYKTQFYFSAAAAIILAFLLLINFYKNSITPEKYTKLQQTDTMQQKENIAAQSEKSELAKLSSEIKKNKKEQVPIQQKPVMQKKNAKEQNKKSNPPTKQTYKNRNVYAANIPIYTITKNDFLGQQIIGN